MTTMNMYVYQQKRSTTICGPFVTWRGQQATFVC